MKTHKKKSKKTNQSELKYSEEESIMLGISLDEPPDDEYYDNDEFEKDTFDYENEEQSAEYNEVTYTSKDYDKKIKKRAAKEKFYVDPKKFDDEITAYYNSEKISDELADMLAKIAHKLSYAPNFINYSYREEMVGDGIIRMFKALMTKKYCHVKGNNPFSYFTRIAFNAFRNRIKKEKKIYEAHEKYKEEYLMLSESYNKIVSKNSSFRKNQY